MMMMPRVLLSWSTAKARLRPNPDNRRILYTMLILAAKEIMVFVMVAYILTRFGDGFFIQTFLAIKRHHNQVQFIRIVLSIDNNKIDMVNAH